MNQTAGATNAYRRCSKGGKCNFCSSSYYKEEILHEIGASEGKQNVQTRPSFLMHKQKQNAAMFLRCFQAMIETTGSVTVRVTGTYRAAFQRVSARQNASRVVTAHLAQHRRQSTRPPTGQTTPRQ